MTRTIMQTEWTKKARRFAALRQRVVLVEGYYQDDEQGGFVWKTSHQSWAWASVFAIKQPPSTLGFTLHQNASMHLPLVISQSYQVIIRGNMERAQKIAHILWNHKKLSISGAELCSEAGYVVLHALFSEMRKK